MKFRGNLTLRLLKPYGAHCALYGLFAVLSVVFTMGTALSVADFLRILFDTGDETVTVTANMVAQWLDTLYVWLISFGQLKALLLFSGIIFSLYFLKNVFSFLSTVEMAIICSRVVRNLRNLMFDKAMHLPMSYYDHNRKGDVMARFTSSVGEYEKGILGSLQMFFTAIISMVLYLSMLFYLNVKLTLFVLCMLPLVALVISGISHRLKRGTKLEQERESYIISLIDEAIGGLKVIKAYTAIDFSNRRFKASNREYTRIRTSVLRRIDAASPVSDFLGNTIVIGILLFGAWLVFSGDQGLTSELFISYIMIFVLMIPSAKDLSTAALQIKKGRACADRITAFLGEDEEDYSEHLGKPVIPENPEISENPKKSAVEFRHVSFSYNPGTEVLHDINIEVPRGTTLALVGSSGSGKSTIADLLCRFYPCVEGQILFDGVDIATISLGELRKRIGVVAQDTLLFNDTVAANIAFGRPDATEEEIVAAARAAQAHDFILQLPEGYNTNLGDGGGLLSGGQRQRISIARALLLNPDVLLLDEATSALDTENERLIQNTLNEVLRGRTAIVIAHRLSTIVGADCIVVLDHGRVVECGTHAELMALGGRYKQLVDLQSF
ncbi:MAG: ABC transporter ATP-binding protein [bacterium]